MSVGTLLLGLVLALYLGASPEMQVFGWVMAAFGALGVAMRFALPQQQRRRG